MIKIALWLLAYLTGVIIASVKSDNLLLHLGVEFLIAFSSFGLFCLLCTRFGI